ncbi:MAG: tetratricopeptide repeat protein [Flavobacterium sp.]|nr:tetratricopeptide repeat protein [Flavobacterium sp.]
MSKFSFIILTFFWISISHAQYDVDSLKSVLNNPKLHDTTRLANISLLIDNIFDNTEFIKYTNLMGAIAQKNLSNKNINPILHKKYTMYLAAYYNNRSIQLEDSGDLKSLDYLNKSIQLYQSVAADDEVYSSIVSKGIILSRRKRYKEAIDCYFKALKYFERIPDKNTDNISYVYTSLGVLYGEQEQWEVAIKYLKKSIAFIDKKAEKQTVEDNLQKCLMYYNIGSAYITLKKFPEATTNLQWALALSKEYRQNSFTSFSLAKLGLIDLHFKRFDAAEQKLIEAIALAESATSKGSSLAYLGNVYFEKKDFKNAQSVLEKALVFAEASKNSDLRERVYELMYKINKINGNYKKAVTMLEMFNAIRDSTKLAETKDELKQQQLKYDYEKKELNYKLNAQRESAAKNTLLTWLSSIVLLLLIGAYFLYRNYKQKQAIAYFEKNELNQKLLLSQMNPHFIFNSIDNIQSLIYNKQDKDAVNYLTKFSKLTRQILENSNESYITLSEELTMIDNYLVIQQLLYNNKFDFNIEVDTAIDPETVLLPPMLAQPFIENAIKHGLKHTTEQGFINISFKFKNDKLFFEIIDNGVGFKTDEMINKKSLAMKITKERLANIAKKSDFEIQLENSIDVQKNIVGAKVFFEIPYIYEK